jgi:hypothetical protein
MGDAINIEWLGVSALAFVVTLICAKWAHMALISDETYMSIGWKVRRQDSPLGFEITKWANILLTLLMVFVAMPVLLARAFGLWD